MTSQGLPAFFFEAVQPPPEVRDGSDCGTAVAGMDTPAAGVTAAGFIAPAGGSSTQGANCTSEDA